MSSNEPRDQLAEIVNRNYMQCIDARPIRTPWEPIADAVIGAGWRPPPRVIQAADEFEALRPGSVVLHSPCSDTPMSACVWVKTGGWWESTGHDALYDGYDLESHRDEGETMTVLWSPEEACQ